jgi:outer membrane protein W
MNKGKVFLATVAVLALLAGAVQAEMWAGGYLGGTWGANNSSYLSVSPVRIFPDDAVVDINTKLAHTAHIQGAFQGGLKIGAWFEKSGVLSGINFPTWMKYFGFYTDFSYHRLNFRHDLGTATYNVRVVLLDDGSYTFSGSRPFGLYTEGYAATWAFMFAGRYGFLPDSDVPFGRLQLMLAVGPAILFSGQNPTFTSYYSASGFGPYALWKPGSQSSTDICLAVEAGLRYMALKNVSIDATFKYRYAEPTYKYTAVLYNEPTIRPTVTLNPTYHLFSFQIGANYHF